MAKLIIELINRSSRHLDLEVWHRMGQEDGNGGMPPSSDLEPLTMAIQRGELADVCVI